MQLIELLNGKNLNARCVEMGTGPEHKFNASRAGSLNGCRSHESLDVEMERDGASVCLPLSNVMFMLLMCLSMSVTGTCLVNISLKLCSPGILNKCTLFLATRS